MQSKGVYENVRKVQKYLENFAIGDKGKHKDINISVKDFDQCELERLWTFDKKLKSKRLADYKIKIKQVTDNNSDLYSRYKFEFEHVVVSKNDGCMRVISSLQNDGEKYFLCRCDYDLGASREERLPKLYASSINDLYRVETEEF